MTITAITPITPKGPYGAVAPGDLIAAFVACDASNGNSFPLTGHEILEVRNTDSGSHHVTLTSVADSRGRTSDIASYAIAAGVDVVFSFLGGIEGWGQTDGTMHFTADDATVKARVLIVKR